MRNLEEAKKFFEKDRYAVGHTGAVIEDVKDGYAKVSVQITDDHRGAHGQVMGGVLFTLADLAFAAASNDEDNFTATASSNISFITGAKGGKLTAEAHLIRNGRRLCFADIEVRDENGELIATVSVTGVHI